MQQQDFYADQFERENFSADEVQMEDLSKKAFDENLQTTLLSNEKPSAKAGIRRDDTVIQHLVNRMKMPLFAKIREQYENNADLGDNEQAILEFACATNNLPLLEEYLVKSTDPTIKCMDYAIANGNLAVVKRLLRDERISPISRIAAVGNKPELLHHHIVIAAHKGDTDIFDALLRDVRTDPSAENNHALQVAIESENDAMITAILHDSRTKIDDQVFESAQKNPRVYEILKNEATLRLGYLQAVAEDDVEKMIDIEVFDFNPNFENGLALLYAVESNSAAALDHMLKSSKFFPNSSDPALLKRAVAVASTDAFKVLVAHFLRSEILTEEDISGYEWQMQLQSAASLI